MRWSEIKKKKINKKSPFTNPPKDFVFDRAIGPLGGLNRDGSKKIKEARKPYRIGWRGRMGEYNSDFFDIELDDLLGDDGQSIAQRDKLIPKQSLELVDEDKGLIWRGMSANEFSNIIQTKQIQSLGDYNIGPEQVGLTYFTTSLKTAESYANSFAPRNRKPTFDSPAYIIGIQLTSDLKTKKVQGVGEHEVGVIGPIPISKIIKIYQGDVISYDPGIDDKNFKSAPYAQLHWHEIALPKNITESVKTAMMDPSYREFKIALEKYKSVRGIILTDNTVYFWNAFDMVHNEFTKKLIQKKIIASLEEVKYELEITQHDKIPIPRIKVYKSQDMSPFHYVIDDYDMKKLVRDIPLFRKYFPMAHDITESVQWAIGKNISKARP